MIAVQSVFLNADRTKAVAEGDKDAKFLLVREGSEIADAEAEKYEGALALIGEAAKPKAKQPPPAPPPPSQPPVKSTPAPRPKKTPKKTPKK